MCIDRLYLYIQFSSHPSNVSFSSSLRCSYFALHSWFPLPAQSLHSTAFSHTKICTHIVSNFWRIQCPVPFFSRGFSVCYKIAIKRGWFIRVASPILYFKWPCVNTTWSRIFSPKPKLDNSKLKKQKRFNRRIYDMELSAYNNYTLNYNYVQSRDKMNIRPINYLLQFQEFFGWTALLQIRHRTIEKQNIMGTIWIRFSSAVILTFVYLHIQSKKIGRPKW